MANEKYLITSDEIAAMEGVKKTHFINPNAKRINKSLGDAVGLTGFGFHIIEVEPGHETTEHHLHYHEDECVFVLSGSATAFIGDEEFAIGVGDFIGYRKAGLPHSIKNTGTETLRCIVVGERRAHDVGDYPRLNKRVFRNAGMPWSLVDLDQVKELGGSVGKKVRLRTTISGFIQPSRKSQNPQQLYIITPTMTPHRAMCNRNPCLPTARPDSASISNQAAALAGHSPSPTSTTSAEAGASDCRTVPFAADSIR